MLKPVWQRLLLSVQQDTFWLHVGSTLMAQFISLVALVCNGAITARWLGPEGKGIVTIVLILVPMLGLFLGGGMGMANVYFAGSRRIETKTLLGNTLVYTGSSAIVCILLVSGALLLGWVDQFLPGIPYWAVWLAVGIFPLTLFQSNLVAMLRGLGHIYAANIVEVSLNMALLVCTALLVIGLRLDVAGALLAFGLSQLVGLAVACSWLLRLEDSLPFACDWRTMGQMLWFGVRGWFGRLLQFFNYRLDAFIVNFFLGPASAGIYSVAVVLVELLWQLPNAVGFVLLPRVAAEQTSNKQRITGRVFLITMGITCLGAIALAVGGSYAISLIFSDAFSAAYVPMLVLLPGVVLLGGARVLISDIVGRGYPLYASITSGISLVISVSSGLYLIPRYGIMGAAAASSISYTTIFVFSLGMYLLVKWQQTRLHQTKTVLHQEGTV